MTKREELSKKYNDNINNIKSLKLENVEIYKELCLLSDDKQWYTEEIVTVSKGKKKLEILRGYINWNQSFKDGDTDNSVTVTRKMVIKENNEWI